MKLRIKGNSVRLRLDRRDIQRLIDEARVADAVRFGPDQSFVYAVEAGSAPRGRPTVSYVDGSLTVFIDPVDAREWISSDSIGFDHQQPVEGGVVRVVLEKDLACVDRRPGEEADDAYAFPNPATSC